MKESEDENKPHENDKFKTDYLIRIFREMRDKHEARQSKDKKEAVERKDKMRVIENELLRRAHRDGAEGFKTKAGTTYLGEDVHVSIADDSLFRGFLEDEEDPYGWFTRRISLERVREYFEEMGEYPKGLNVFREQRMKIRAPTKKRGRSKARSEEDDNDEEE